MLSRFYFIKFTFCKLALPFYPLFGHSPEKGIVSAALGLAHYNASVNSKEIVCRDCHAVDNGFLIVIVNINKGTRTVFRAINIFHSGNL